MNFTAHQADQRLVDHETKTGPAIAPRDRGIDLGEYFEQLFFETRWDTGAGVGDLKPVFHESAALRRLR